MHLLHCIWKTSWKWFHHSIRKLIKNYELVNSMNDTDLWTWTSFVDVVKIFLGNYLAKNSKKLLEKLLKSQVYIGANMSIYVHFLHCHLHKFPNKCGDMSDEQDRKMPSGYQNNGRTLPETMGQENNGWLQLEYRKWVK